MVSCCVFNNKYFIVIFESLITPKLKTINRLPWVQTARTISNRDLPSPDTKWKKVEIAVIRLIKWRASPILIDILLDISRFSWWFQSIQLGRSWRARESNRYIRARIGINYIWEPDKIFQIFHECSWILYRYRDSCFVSHRARVQKIKISDKRRPVCDKKWYKFIPGSFISRRVRISCRGIKFLSHIEISCCDVSLWSRS